MLLAAMSSTRVPLSYCEPTQPSNWQRGLASTVSLLVTVLSVRAGKHNVPVSPQKAMPGQRTTSFPFANPRPAVAAALHYPRATVPPATALVCT
jgi:hypothetical protein